MSVGTFFIKPIVDLEGCRAFQEVQQRIWVGAKNDIIPLHVLITLAKNGGVLLGAYEPDGPRETNGMVGFVVGWLGADREHAQLGIPPKLKFCSHMVGVLPSRRGHDIGLHLKLAQREMILAQGLTDYVTWTYDPLQRVNGALNIHRLGAICTTYIRNAYGDMSDILNAGAPSDRCRVDWYLRSLRVVCAIDPNCVDPSWDTAAIQILAIQKTTSGLQQPGPYHLNFDGRAIAAPLPDAIASMRKQDAPLALEWCLYMRDVFEQAFAAGYALVDCVGLGAYGWRYIFVPLCQINITGTEEIAL